LNTTEVDAGKRKIEKPQPKADEILVKVKD
jgi:hypothetical protein